MLRIKIFSCFQSLKLELVNQFYMKHKISIIIQTNQSKLYFDLLNYLKSIYHKFDIVNSSFCRQLQKQFTLKELNMLLRDLKYYIVQIIYVCLKFKLFVKKGFLYNNLIFLGSYFELY